jgi:PHD/YefM family antitoxin component YafN of YafNO toxin-antitoxin module
MEFLSVREFRSASRKVWQKLSQDGKMIITNKGKPAALLLDLANEDLEETLETLRQVEAMRLFNKMRGEAEKRGFLSEEEIEVEIQAARSDMRAREEAV